MPEPGLCHEHHEKREQVVGARRGCGLVPVGDVVPVRSGSQHVRPGSLLFLPPRPEPGAVSRQVPHHVANGGCHVPRAGHVGESSYRPDGERVHRVQVARVQTQRPGRQGLDRRERPLSLGVVGGVRFLHPVKNLTLDATRDVPLHRVHEALPVRRRPDARPESTTARYQRVKRGAAQVRTVAPPSPESLLRGGVV